MTGLLLYNNNGRKDAAIIKCVPQYPSEILERRVFTEAVHGAHTVEIGSGCGT